VTRPRTIAGDRFGPLLALCGKELRQFFRDGALVLFLFYGFFVSVPLAATGARMELANAAFAVVDHDKSPASRDLIHAFRPPHFRLVGEADSTGEAAAMLDDGTAVVVLSIPPRFGEDRASGRSPQVQVLVDTSHASLGVLAASAASSIVARHGAIADTPRASRNRSARGDLVDAQRVRYNPNRDERRFQAIDQILKMATLFAMLLPGAALARERERGTIEQLLVSPLSPSVILLSKILPMTLLVTAASTASLIVMVRGVLGIPVQGQIWHFSIVIAALAVAMAGIGILIATIGRTVGQVGLLAMLVLSPLMLLSGAHTPPESLPIAVRPVMYLSPLHYSIDAAMGVVLRGAGLDVLAPLVAGTTLLAVATSMLALLRFRRGFR